MLTLVLFGVCYADALVLCFDPAMQALCVCTLGSEADAQRIDGIRTADTSMDDDSAAADTAAPGGTVYERFYLQYFFPPSSVGECGRVGPAGQSAKCCLNCSTSLQPMAL